MAPDRTETLLSDLQWLQALARELVRDPELAADAVQDTCVAALRQGDGVRHPRAWLATVLRRCLLLRGRSHTRSERRQAEAARPEASEGTAELVQRAELQQQLVAVVLQLPAHHRDVVLLRFFDGLPPRAIAKQLDVPIATVHSRLQRALQQLRAQLDDGPGGRAAWAAVALSVPAAETTVLPLLGVLMQTKLKVALGVLAAAGSVTWWWSSGSDSQQGAALAAPPERTPRRGGDSGGSGGGASLASESSRRLDASLPPSSPDAGPARVTVRGRVCGCDGVALPGVPVAARGGAATTVVSDSLGAFAIDLLPQPTSLLAGDERYVTVMGAQWSPDTKVEPVLVVAEAVLVGGRVVDSNGGAVARAHVLLQLPEDFDARFPMPLDRGERSGWQARTDGNGRFELGRVPRLQGGTLLAAAEALRPASVPLPATDDREVQIVLTPFAYEEGQLDGIVVDAQNAPVAGARVVMGVTSVVSDGEGRFALLLRRAGWPTAIVGAKAGYLPGRFELPRGGGAKRDDWPERVVLRLGSSPQSIHGRVVDGEDVPIEGAVVWIADPTLLGIAGVLPLQTEYVLAGGELPAQAARMQVPLADEPTREDMFMDQTSPARQPTACWWFATTGEGGTFELPGLLPRDYRIAAFDPKSGVTGDAGPVPAGGRADVRIVRTGLWPEVRGRVVSLRGEPLAGVQVSHSMGLFTSNERVPGGRFEGNVVREVAKTRSGDDGTFVLQGINRERSVLGCHSDAILPRKLAAAKITDPLAVELKVEARCHVEVVLRDPSEADEVLALTAEGEQVDISILRSGSHRAETELQLHEGKSGVFVLGERAATLVLRRGGAPVRRVALQLEPGRTFSVQ